MTGTITDHDRWSLQTIWSIQWLINWRPYHLPAGPWRQQQPPRYAALGSMRPDRKPFVFKTPLSKGWQAIYFQSRGKSILGEKLHQGYCESQQPSLCLCMTFITQWSFIHNISNSSDAAGANILFQHYLIQIKQLCRIKGKPFLKLALFNHHKFSLEGCIFIVKHTFSQMHAPGLDGTDVRKAQRTSAHYKEGLAVPGKRSGNWTVTHG